MLANPEGVIGNFSLMAAAIRTLSARPSQGYEQVVQTPAAMQPVPAVQPVGQLSVPQEFVAHVAVHAQESAQSTEAQALVPEQITLHAPSAHSMLSQAFVPEHVIWQVVSPRPQSMSPHALLALQLITHDVASPHSIDGHAPPLPHVMLHA
jgi:hypothetical protein